MQNDTDAELQLKLIFETNSDRLSRYQAASKLFGIKPQSTASMVFRLWFDERHAKYEKDGFLS